MKVITTFAASGIAALMATSALAAGETITINSFGGAYEKAHRQCIIDPFEKETGATVQIVTAYSADAFAQLRAQKDALQQALQHEQSVSSSLREKNTAESLKRLHRTVCCRA